MHAYVLYVYMMMIKRQAHVNKVGSIERANDIICLVLIIYFGAIKVSPT